MTMLGGCEVAAPDAADRPPVLLSAPTWDEIASSLHEYARSLGMESTELILPLDIELTDWADMADYAVRHLGIEGPVLVGTQAGRRVLVGAEIRLGHPGTDDDIEQAAEIVTFGGPVPLQFLRHWRRTAGGRIDDLLLSGSEILEDIRLRMEGVLFRA